MKKILMAALVTFIFCTASVAAVRKVGEIEAIYVEDAKDTSVIEFGVSENNALAFVDDVHGMEFTMPAAHFKELQRAIEKTVKIIVNLKELKEQGKNADIKGTELISKIGSENVNAKFLGIKLSVVATEKTAVAVIEFVGAERSYPYIVDEVNLFKIALEYLMKEYGGDNNQNQLQTTSPPDKQPAVEATKLPQLSGHRPLTKSTAMYGYVTARGLNIRADHNAQSRIVGQAKQGASLSIVDSWYDYENGFSWYKIDDLNEWGWVSGKYVATAQTPLTGTVTVKSGNLNVFRDHTTGSEAWGRINKGSRWNISEAWAADNDPYPWFKIVDASGNIGWITGRHFKLDNHQANDGWLLSDEEYREFMEYSDFATAENEMTEAWNALKERVSGMRYEELLKGQKTWIATRRNRVATNFYNKFGWSKRECYRQATLERAKELQGALKNAEGTNQGAQRNVYEGEYSFTTPKDKSGSYSIYSASVKLLNSVRSLYEVELSSVTWAYPDEADGGHAMQIGVSFKGKGVIQNGSGLIEGVEGDVSGDDVMYDDSRTFRYKVFFKENKMSVVAGQGSSGNLVSRKRQWNLAKEQN